MPTLAHEPSELLESRLLADIDLTLFETGVACLLGAGTATEVSEVALHASPDTFELIKYNETYGSCFPLTEAAFNSYEFVGEEPIDAVFERGDLQRSTRYVAKVGARQLQLRFLPAELTLSAVAANGHEFEQGFAIFDSPRRRRGMPINTGITQILGCCETPYVTVLRSQFEQFRNCDLAMAVCDSELGITLSAENGKRVARWPACSGCYGSAGSSQFFSLYTVETPVAYKFSAASVARVLQVLQAAVAGKVRALRLEFFDNAVMWLLQVGEADGVPIYVRHDVPKMHD